MGFFSSLGKAFGFGNDSGQEQFEAIAAANRLAKQGVEDQFGQTKANLDPFISAGRGALDETVQGSTIGGFAERLSEIFGTDIFKTLVGERTNAIEGQLASSGNARSGLGLETIANIPTGIGVFLEQLLTGRSQKLANQGVNTAFNLAAFGQNKANVIAGVEKSTGIAQASGIAQDAQANAAGFGKLLGIGGKALGGALAGGFNVGGFGDSFTGSGLARAGQGAPRLKMNTRVVGRIGPLNIYLWDWIPETKATIVELCPTEGFLSNEVKEIYPEHVYDFGGFDVIDYESVFAELRAA